MSELVLEKNIVIQNGWILTTLDEFSFLTFGQSPPSSSYNKNEKGLPFFQGRAEFGKLYPEIKVWCTQPNRIAEKNDVLICVRAGVGGTNLNPTQSCIGRGLASIRSLYGVNSLYILYYLRSIENVLSLKGRGSTLTGITSQELRQLQIPVAPLNEQKRIVAKIEELFSKLDFVKTSTLTIKLQLEQMRNSLLKSTFEGKFVKELQTSKLVDICKKITDGEHFKPNYVSRGVPFLTAKNVRDDGVLFSDIEFISNTDAVKSRNRCNPEQGDILMVSRGATIGRTCLINTDRKFCLLGSVILIKLDNTVTPKFLLYFLKSPHLQKQLITVSGSTAQQAIYLRDIGNISISFPSIKEQNRIVSQLELQLTLIENNENMVNAILKILEKTRTAILKYAFEGKLIPQDPNDESVEILLEKIKQEKQKIISQTKRRKKNDK